MSAASSPEDPANPKEFSLGGAIWGFPVASDCAEPGAYAPDAWLLEFVEHHAEGAWLGILWCCKAGRVWALQTSKSATLTIDATASPAQLPVPRQVRAAIRDLAVRGALPTRLCVAIDDSPESTAASRHITAFLQGTAVTQVELDQGVIAKLSLGPAYTDLLATLSAPQITTLTLTSCNALLPHPASLPSLRELHITTGQRWLCTHTQAKFCRRLADSCAPYTKQLTTLTLPGMGDAWSRLFTGAAPAAPNLTRLTSPDTLSNALLGQLAAHAPRLKQLSVARVGLYNKPGSVPVGASLEWQLERLLVHDGYADAYSLGALPVSQAGSIQVFMKKLYFNVSMQGLLADERVLCQRLAAGQMRLLCVEQVSVHPQPVELGMPRPAEQPALLLGALQLVTAALQDVPAVAYELFNWECTPAMAHAAAAGFAASCAAGHRAAMRGLRGPLTDELVSMVRGCAPMQFDLYLEKTLTDEHLTSVLQLGEQIRHLKVYGIRLQSDQHANTPWPWEELTCGLWSHLRRNQSVQAARPAPCGQLRDFSIHLSDQACTDGMASRLSAFKWQQLPQHVWLHYSGTGETANSLEGPSQAPTTVVAGTSPVDAPQAPHQSLRIALSALNAIHCPSWWFCRPIIALDYPMTQGVINALADLPKWGCELIVGFAGQAWPLEPAAYRRLAQVIPECYTIWHVYYNAFGGATDAYISVLREVCRGIDESRAASGGKSVTVKTQSHKVAKYVCGTHVVSSVLDGPASTWPTSRWYWV